MQFDQAEAKALFSQAMELLETDPFQAKNLLSYGKYISQQLDDPCLELDFEFWLCGVTLWYQRRYAEALQMSIQGMVEAHKSRYTSCIHRRADMAYVLLASYIDYDPVGYAPKIYETIELLENEMQPDYDLWCLIQWCRSFMAFVLGDLDNALQQVEKYIARSEKSYFRLADAYTLAAIIHYRRQNVEGLRNAAELGEYYASLHGDAPWMLMEGFLWQAYLARCEHDEASAQRLYQRHQKELARVKSKADIYYYEALCVYHEAGHEWEAALETRERQLEDAIQGQSPFIITEAHFHRLRLLYELGRPTEAAFNEAIAAAEGLLDPVPYRARLDQLKEGRDG
ncbi:MAG: hypothetical protein MUF87_19285 [Anaerolineae bacterium]|jgi:hypothetical protein|nr:hypothetical protein [Anaerolineae bacterium]